jgi:ATP synthase A1 C subunit
MSDYGYLNARVRAMGAELLPAELYEQLLAVEGEDRLTELLLDTPYAPQVQEALAVGRGPEALESALGRNLRLSFAKLLSIAPPEPRRLLCVQVSQWDAANILAVVRGIATGAEPQEITQAVLPVGEFSEPQLAELADQPDLASLSNALSTWGYAFAFQLRQVLRDPRQPRDLVSLEAAINSTYFQWALEQLAARDPGAGVVRRMVRMQIDLANVRESLDLVRHKIREEPLEGFQPLAGGLLSGKVFEAILASLGMIEAFEALEGTYFAPGIERGILAYGEAGSLGVMERFLEAVVIEEGSRLYRGDPLGVQVPLGFLWRKYGEFLNLRIVVRGKRYRMPVNAIREELALV